jgi:hypothetical protein
MFAMRVENALLKNCDEQYKQYRGSTGREAGLTDPHRQIACLGCLTFFEDRRMADLRDPFSYQMLS